MKSKKLIFLMCFYLLCNYTYAQNPNSAKLLNYVMFPLQLTEFNSSHNRGYLFKPDSINVYINSDPNSPEPDLLTSHVKYEYDGNLVKTIDLKYFDTPENNVYAEYVYDVQGRIIQIDSYGDVIRVLKIIYSGDEIVSMKTYEDDLFVSGDSVAIDLTPNAISYKYYYALNGGWVINREIKNISSDYRNYTNVTYSNGEPLVATTYENIDFHKTYEKSFIRKLKLINGFDSISFSNSYFIRTPLNTPFIRPIRYTRYSVDLVTGVKTLVQKSFATYDNQKIDYQIYNFSGGDSTLFESGYLLYDSKDRITEHDLQRSTVDFNGLYSYDDNLDLFTSGEFVNNGTVSGYSYNFKYDQNNIINELIYGDISSLGIVGIKYEFFQSPTLVKTNTSKQFKILYPNPTSNQLMFELPESELSGNYQVIDSKGNTIQFGKVLSNVVDVATLPSGIYFLRLANHSGVYQSKFVKVN